MRNSRRAGGKKIKSTKAERLGRHDHVSVKTARGRKASSTRWLSRQLNDPYVMKARELGYRSRAAFKLSELDARFKFLRSGLKVVDLGASPGGWTQVAVSRVGSGNVFAIDILPMDPIKGAQIIHADIRDLEKMDSVVAKLDRSVNVVLSDMAPAATGHRATDHLRIVALVEEAFSFANRALCRGGVFVAKVYQGGSQSELLSTLKRSFNSVKHAKPAASRSSSAETYVIAAGFRGFDLTEI